jgi:hypothetical protein
MPIPRGDINTDGLGRYSLAEGIVEAAKAQGLFGNVAGFILRAASESGPYKHPEGNRRYFNYLLDIQGGVVVGIKRMDSDTPMSRAGAKKADLSKEIVAQVIKKHLGG